MARVCQQVTSSVRTARVHLLAHLHQINSYSSLIHILLSPYRDSLRNAEIQNHHEIKIIFKAKDKKWGVLLALLWKTSVLSVIGCILAMQQYLHSWKARIKLILYIYGRGEGEQKSGQVRLRNQLALLACTSEHNSSFAALATCRKVMCGCLHAHCGECEPSVQLLPLGK